MVMNEYDAIREGYRPAKIHYLLIAESPPPPPDFEGSRHFYRTDRARHEDRLFTNTIKALYPETTAMTEPELEASKDEWLRRFQADGWYMIEALEESQAHKVTKPQRQERIREHLPRLVERVTELADSDTKIILIKSNVFEVAAEPLRAAGFNVLNQKLVDYPGHYNQAAYREKLANLIAS